VLADVPNRITLEGHTDAQPFSSGDRGYSNWELSSDRANSSRRELVSGGLPEDRMLLVQGLASSTLFDASDPQSPVNRRISIIVMNRDAEDRVLHKPVDTLDLASDSQIPAIPNAPALTPNGASHER
jgi:chemotaxis protein MotB